jgi:putative sterol carrier protein
MMERDAKRERRRESMAQTAQEFFDGLESRLDPAKLAGQAASYRFDIEGAGSWRVDVVDGRASVSEGGEGGDCVIRMRSETFAKLLRGEQSPVTGFMTGKIKVDGDLSHALRLKELFF